MRHRLIPHFIHDQYRSGNSGGQLAAAALFIDISGFTAMSQALMKHGKVGAELLSTILNEIFEPVIFTV